MRSKLTPRILKAIAVYCEQKGLKPQLSVPPTFYFINSKGEEIKTQLINILSFYDQHKKRAKAPTAA